MYKYYQLVKGEAWAMTGTVFRCKSSDSHFEHGGRQNRSSRSHFFHAKTKLLTLTNFGDFWVDEVVKIDEPTENFTFMKGITGTIRELLQNSRNGRVHFLLEMHNQKDRDRMIAFNKSARAKWRCKLIKERLRKTPDLFVCESHHLSK